MSFRGTRGGPRGSFGGRGRGGFEGGRGGGFGGRGGGSRGGGFGGRGGGDRGRGRGGDRGRGGRGGFGRAGLGAGSKVLIQPHERFAGVYVLRGKDDALVTKNLTPGESVYNEKRVSMEVSGKIKNQTNRLKHRNV